MSGYPRIHLVRFGVEEIGQLELSELVRHYAGRGSDAYHPAMMPGVIGYGYAPPWCTPAARSSVRAQGVLRDVRHALLARIDVFAPRGWTSGSTPHC